MEGLWFLSSQNSMPFYAIELRQTLSPGVLGHAGFEPMRNRQRTGEVYEDVLHSHVI